MLTSVPCAKLIESDVVLLINTEADVALNNLVELVAVVYHPCHNRSGGLNAGDSTAGRHIFAACGHLK